MFFIADFHIHSRFSRATSRDLDLEHLHAAAQLKGIRVVGTGDFTHPGWLAEIREKLEPAEPGLFRLREASAAPIDASIPASCRAPVRFMLSVEISSIYSRGGKTRKVHNLICMPDIEKAARFATRLSKLGNVESDGRPILGLDSRNLLEIMAECDDEAFLIPAHIWTPWFSVLGSRSGFDSLEECFEDLIKHIFAVETGLSSDPPMNWRLSTLDKLALVSNSDAHSPSRLGREANCFDTELSFPAIRKALASKDKKRFLGTIEFFPEEGKYHLDGHRKCATRMEPRETRQEEGKCPRCGRPVTVGVLHRVEELADRPDGVRPQGALQYTSLLSLAEVIAQALAVGPGSKRVLLEQQRLQDRLGPELKILRDIPLDSLAGAVSPLVVEGLRRMRAGNIRIAPGYDGEFGKIELFEEGERDALMGQCSFLSYTMNHGRNNPAKKIKKITASEVNPSGKTNLRSAAPEAPALFSAADLVQKASVNYMDSLNPQQRKAVEYEGGPMLVVAGPGTGKTRTLVHHIAYRIRQCTVPPKNILALTFTNKAANEMSQRLKELLDDPEAARCVTVRTFHAFCRGMLEDVTSGGSGTFRLCDELERRHLIKRTLVRLGMNTSSREIRCWSERISLAKQRLQGPDDAEALGEQASLFIMVYHAYQKELAAIAALDLDDLIFVTVRRLQEDSDWRNYCLKRWRCILVDEYQDINPAQYRLIRLLAPGSPDLCAIGDPNQAIYGFRGADMAFFLRFRQDYPDAYVVSLDRNYRSTEAILKASGQVIARGNGASYHPARPLSEGGARLTITNFPHDRAEAAFIARQVESLMEGVSLFSMDSARMRGDGENTYGFGDFAILYRLNAQAAPLEEALEKRGIPFQRAGHDTLLERPEVRDVIEGLRFLTGIRSGHREDLQDLQNEVGKVTVRTFIRKVSERMGINAVTVELLAGVAEPFGTSLQEFLNHIILMYEPDILDSRAERVALMTLHASKGLEFPVVFIAGCEEGLIPFYPQGTIAALELEEERRLFYVGLTRAKERVFLTHARTRLLFGERRSGRPSPFLSDINEELLQRISPSRGPRFSRSRSKRQMCLFGRS